MSAWQLLLIGALAGLGLRELCVPIARWLRAWAHGKLHARHERDCAPRNTKWRGRLVRHVVSGRVGYCQKVCVPGGNIWRQAFFPQWHATLIVNPQIASYIHKSGGAGMFFMPPDEMLRVPLAEITLAPRDEAAAFREQMEGAEP